jgi:nucleoside-diphosphate-sugar epimerase
VNTSAPGRKLVVLGGTGFVGSHFISAARAGGWDVRALTRGGRSVSGPDGVEWVQGDIQDPSVWQKLLIPDCVVVNLVHAQHVAGPDAAAATRYMVQTCAQAGVSRLVHCSSISVYGRAAVGHVDERTPCRPVDDYGRHKLAVEQALFELGVGGMQITVLRPTAVFGAGGAALRSLAASLAQNSSLTNYLRSSLFGYRQMHLVPVSVVASALSFLCEVGRDIHGEVFIVSDDAESLNNFRDVEGLLMQALKVPAYRLPRLDVSRWLLSLMLRAKGRGEIDSTCTYSMEKLYALGFVRDGNFDSALRAYVADFSEVLQ